MTDLFQKYGLTKGLWYPKPLTPPFTSPKFLHRPLAKARQKPTMQKWGKGRGGVDVSGRRILES